MDTLHVATMPYGCDWDQWCGAVFGTLDELDAHERKHWAAEDTRNDGLRSDDRFWAYNTMPGAVQRHGYGDEGQR